MRSEKVWDPLVRIFHWSLVAAFGANALLTDPEGRLHEVIGYVALGLVGFRLVWGLIGSRHARFADFPPSASAALGQMQEMATGRRRAHMGHSPLGALMIYNLLAVLVVIGVSGFLMTTNTWFGVEWVEELHEVAVTWAEISVLAHVGAVILESRRLRVNLARAMVTGVKTVPDESPAR